MSKPRCYIAGKIGDLPEQEYKEYFLQAKQEVEFLGYTPVSPVELPHLHARTWADYMREDLREMLSCDAVYALRNWLFSPGATIEVNLALKLDIKVILQKS